jgi:hypothetical protein
MKHRHVSIIDNSFDGNCPNCSKNNLSLVRRIKILRGAYDADLVHCQVCDFLFLWDPYWLREAYKNTFYGDTGYVLRNIEASHFVRLLFLCFHAFNSNFNFNGCDFGTGLGIFPRLMRDYGYEFWGSDEYADMQLIKPFVNPGFSPNVCTAFEVVEHLYSFPQFLKQHIINSDIFIFSTTLRADGHVPSSDWWYYCFDFGQHIGFHSRKSILYALDELNYTSTSFLSINGSLHAIVFNKKWNNPLSLALILYNNPVLKSLMNLLARVLCKRSLTYSDHQYILNNSF